jgi:hypothetical protein
LLTTLRSLDAASAALTATLGRMEAAYDGGAMYSASNVESVTGTVTELLYLASDELTETEPTLPAGDTAAAQALAASLHGALAAFDSTNSLNLTSSSGVSGELPTGLIDAASGGALVAQYQGDLRGVTTMEGTTEKEFVAALHGGPSAP